MIILYRLFLATRVVSNHLVRVNAQCGVMGSHLVRVNTLYRVCHYTVSG